MNGLGRKVLQAVGVAFTAALILIVAAIIVGLLLRLLALVWGLG